MEKRRQVKMKADRSTSIVSSNTTDNIGRGGRKKEGWVGCSEMDGCSCWMRLSLSHRVRRRERNSTERVRERERRRKEVTDTQGIRERPSIL